MYNFGFRVTRTIADAFVNYRVTLLISGTYAQTKKPKERDTMTQNKATIALDTPALDADLEEILGTVTAAQAAYDKKVEATKAAQAARKEWIETLPSATPDDVSVVVEEIREGVRPSISIPTLVEVTKGVFARIDKKSQAHDALKTAIKKRVDHLQSKAGRANVDETIGKMKCTSFCLTTKKLKKGTKAIAAVRFES